MARDTIATELLLHKDMPQGCTCQARPTRAGGTRGLLRPDQQ